MKPTYVNSSLANTFAGRTLRKRLPSILKSVIKKNRYRKEPKQNLKQLLNELPYAQIKPFDYINNEEEKYWQALFEEFAETPWIDLPFYLAEALFYRKILKATNWYDNHKDPFLKHKEENLEAQAKSIHQLLGNTKKLLDQPFNEEDFIYLLKQNLWGNQADLSLFYDGNIPESSANKQEYLLHDDSIACSKYISKGCQQIDFLIDNVGIELVGDICLAIYLLKHEKAQSINFHVKAAPLFVSDAMEVDVRLQIENITEQHSKFASIAMLFNEFVEAGKIQVLPDLYWNSPLFYNWLPPHLEENFKKSSLTISKGDAHYRRFLQDSMWNHDEPLNTVIDFFGTPLWLLRTLKSEVLAGVENNAVIKAEKLDKNWLTNGKFGVIQFHNFQ